jgi:hypothetical protein
MPHTKLDRFEWKATIPPSLLNTLGNANFSRELNLISATATEQKATHV